MKTLALAVACAALLAAAAPAAAAPVDPAEGGWTAAAAKARGARATVSFAVAAGTATPVVELRVRRCRGARAWSGTLRFAAVSVAGGRFKARHRTRAVRVRVEGRFSSATSARGTVHGRVVLRRRGGRGRVTCKLPRLAWQASLTDPAVADDAVEEDPAEAVEEDPEASEDEWVEDDEWTEEDEEWAEEDDWVPEDDEGYVWEDADEPR